MSATKSEKPIDGIIIEVLNWNKYNPRTDAKKPNWFRFENDVATGPGFFGLDCEIKWMWVFILSLVSVKNGLPIIWNAAYCENLTGIGPKKQAQAIDIFEKFVRLRVSRNVTQRDSYPTNERTDERTDKRGREKPDQIKVILSVWKETLQFFGHDRNLTSREEQLIYQAVQKEDPESVSQALVGARYEPRFKDFNPGKAPDVSRITGDIATRKPSQVAKFMGYASSAPTERVWIRADDEVEGAV